MDTYLAPIIEKIIPINQDIATESGKMETKNTQDIYSLFYNSKSFFISFMALSI